MVRLPDERMNKKAQKYLNEAETFVGIMKELAPEITLDYSGRSLEVLDSFISKRFEPIGSKYVGDSLLVGMGCYVGEVIIRTLGGHWSETGGSEINDIGEIKSIYPIQKVAKRFKNGAIDSLTFYYSTIKEHAGR